MAEQKVWDDLFFSDYLNWLHENVKLIKDEKYAEVDYKNIVIELIKIKEKERKDLAKELTILISNILKLNCAQNPSKIWFEKVYAGRKNIDEILNRNPCLNKEIKSLIKVSRQNALEKIIPQEVQFTKNNIIDFPITFDEVFKVEYKYDYS